MTEAILLSVFLILIPAFLLVRNQIVYKCQMKAGEITHRYAREFNKLIFKSDRWMSESGDWRKFYEIEKSYGSYNEMMYTFTKWKFEHFYPDIEERMKEELK